MQFFYDGQIRRYLIQIIRIFSNFVVQYNDGSLVRVPVLYGDPDRQVASLMRQNSENVLNSCPRIAIYVSELALDPTRISDQSYVNAIHIREREIDNDTNEYTQTQGKNYTIERLMPTPFKLTVKVDIWAASTDQKLQILEQMLVFFNPSLELQTNDNYLDWTSLSVLTLIQVSWSSRSVPVGQTSPTPIDIATLTLETPIWISPPAKVKHIGVITKIISNIYSYTAAEETKFLEDLESSALISHTGLTKDLLASVVVTPENYSIFVIGNTVKLLPEFATTVPNNIPLDVPTITENTLPWEEIFGLYPNKFIAGSSCMYLLKSDGSEICGTMELDPVDSKILYVNWDSDTLYTNTRIDSHGRFYTDPLYNTGLNYRTNSDGSFDAIINPLTTGVGHGISDLAAGDRFLLTHDIGSEINTDGAILWQNLDGSMLIANVDDIIEWTGDRWNVIFDAKSNNDIIIYQTNIFTGVQYMWNGIYWLKSYEGLYQNNKWRMIL